MTRTVQVGSVVVDNDPRRKGQTVEIVGFASKSERSPMPGSILHWVTEGVETRNPNTGKAGPFIRLDRIHADGKPRRSGWSLVQP